MFKEEKMKKMTCPCPRCGSAAPPVPEETVHSLSRREPFRTDNASWNACLNPDCVVGYFSDDSVIEIRDIRVPLWYKDFGGDVPICYCSGLTRDEIKAAVEKGCTTIEAVRRITGKNITGKCRTENPLGQCCHKVFLETISQFSGASAAGLNNKNCYG